MRMRRNGLYFIDGDRAMFSEDENCILESIEIVKELVTQIFERKMLQESFGKDTSEEKFKDWLLARYADFVSHLLAYLSQSEKEIQIKSLEVLLKFITLEAKYPLANVEQEDWFFPKLLFKKIIAVFVSEDLDQCETIKHFKQYSSYVDIKFYTLQAVANILYQKEKVNDIFLSNCFHLLTLCCPSSEDSTTLLSTEGIEKPFVLKGKCFSKLFSNVWETFLKCELPPSLLKKVLVFLPKKVMKHFSNPYLLTDFFTELYSRGGLTSLLALSGLFELMQKYNVEYPDFYIKLYSLFDVNILNSKFNSRFFYLSDLFLSSTHLPAYLVAAFVKRLSRISLAARTECVLKIIPLIVNLLIRHPALTVLIHRTDIKDLTDDPYDFAAIDPAESKALESSLWEIKTLQSHYHPEVSRKAKIIDKELPKLELDFTSSLDISEEDVFRKEFKRSFTEAHTLIENVTTQKNMFVISNKHFKC
ncbi:nucleolar complex protein 4 homolog B isoform X2 [Parasteatoda tepidariorum]|uniref:nucleolar complex protein 4 homolog B isoform X2 n=1 Tax=Parasteatoda tepidariorum TaxID=114398 RepID=UPI001C71ECA4|nr:nucleolar complex protein 4 homolog B isoform X2 [Parasteatoda tepidariorum]